MKKFLSVAILLLCVATISAQKVKFKKGSVLIDDVEVYKYEREGTMETISTLGSTEFMTILSTSYEERNPAHYRPHGENFPALITRWVYTVKFLASGRELVTDLNPKDIAKAVYKSGMIAEDGNIDEEKLNVFVNKYNNDNLKYKLN
ncbi:MAG TPA: hypothetical protein VGB50_13255 [Flavobacterium sp.]|jgi:hypothetical protein